MSSRGRSLRLPSLVVAALAVACVSQRPVLYPNAHYERVGNEGAEFDIAACEELAKANVGREGTGEKAAKQGAESAAVGAAGGAAGGAVVGRAGRGAAVGAAAAGAAGFMRGLFRGRQPDPVYRRYVETCLRERGYRPVGWR